MDGTGLVLEFIVVLELTPEGGRNRTPGSAIDTGWRCRSWKIPIGIPLNSCQGISFEYPSWPVNSVRRACGKMPFA